MLRDILSPLSFLSIEHPSHLPKIINWLIPLILSILFAFFVFAAKRYFVVNFYGQSGFLDKILGITQCLAGFYIAALAAVASLNNNHMDSLMPGEPTKMRIRYNGVLQKIPLTRRRYLCSMFSFLTAYSLIISFGIVFAMIFSPMIVGFLDNNLKKIIWIFGVWFFGMLITQMLAVTFWGLHYLGERVHTPD